MFLITGLSNPLLNPAEFYLVDILQQLIPGADPAQQGGCFVFCLRTLVPANQVWAEAAWRVNTEFGI